MSTRQGSAGPASSPGAGVQGTLDDLEPDLSAVTFVVVDLETTGTRAGTDEITEIGAVRVRGGEVQAELSTFVSIDGTLPPQITRITGIEPADLVGAPSLGEVMSTFLEFSRGAVLVAHNARFDMSFLRAAARATGGEWPDPEVVCTLALSRRILHRGETRSHRLGDLATHLGAQTDPCHRALADARATVDVLHALFSRVGDCGVSTLSELRAYDNRLAPEVRRRSALTDSLPTGPGVYVFRDRAGAALYVGSSISVQRRARSYFSGGDERRRMRTMVGLAETVEGIACAHLLEAWTLEERLIDALQPPFNRRSRAPRRGWWLSPPGPRGALPRVTRTPTAGSVGPFRRADDARHAWAELAEASRQGTGPDGDEWRALADGTDSSLLRSLVARVERLATEGAFERAARLRDRTSVLVGVLARCQELAATASLPELVLAQFAADRTWSIAVVRYGRLAASGTVPRGAAPMPVIEAVRATARTIEPEEGSLRGATPAETSAIHRWIDSAPTRIVSCEGGWTLGVDGARTLRDWADLARQAASGAEAEGVRRPRR